MITEPISALRDMLVFATALFFNVICAGKAGIDMEQLSGLDPMGISCNIITLKYPEYVELGGPKIEV